MSETEPKPISLLILFRTIIHKELIELEDISDKPKREKNMTYIYINNFTYKALDSSNSFHLIRKNKKISWFNNKKAK